jgi:dienelactone hydrolase
MRESAGTGIIQWGIGPMTKVSSNNELRDPSDRRLSRSAEVQISAGAETLFGDLTLPGNPHGVIVFAHGSGSSRFSSRNRAVAAELQARGFATLLLDLLTPKEEPLDELTREFRFDIPLLAGRLAAGARWVASNPETAGLPIGYFGASTGAAAALVAAAEQPEGIRAIVSRGGRPDLAGVHLGRVRAPTLLIVGGRDQQVIELNTSALARLPEPKRLVIVPGATHLFEEPGTLEQVASLAGDWFSLHVKEASAAASR